MALILVPTSTNTVVQSLLAQSSALMPPLSLRVGFAPAASRRTAVPGRTRIPSSQPIDAEAKQLLRGFYAPYNDELARVLGDERFRWADVE